MSTQRQAEQRRLLIWWLTSASILLVVIAAVAVYWIFTTVSSFARSHPTGCLPADFPTYSNVVVEEIDESFGVPSSFAHCRMRLSSRDDFESVNGFYHVQLNVNDWKITNYAENGADSTINFERRSHPATNGVLSVFKDPRVSEIQVQLSG